jgi:hypothetical protein
MSTRTTNFAAMMFGSILLSAGALLIVASILYAVGETIDTIATYERLR